MTPPATSSPTLSDLEALLLRHWGFRKFRPAQEDAVLAGAAGRDLLAILPTGGGKSICYQIPGLYRGGVCLVIGPLVALMADQVSGLKKAGVQADAITSALHPKAVERMLSRYVHGPGGFLFVAPERLTQPQFVAACRDMPIRTIAVDEAHCISQWGHAFRPDYLQLSVLRTWHPEANWIALTATATDRVAGHIEAQLKLKRPLRLRSAMRRPNLSFSVQHIASKEAAVVDWARRVKGTAILYVRTRKQAEQMAILLEQGGLSVAPYHAGMTPESRAEHQSRWLAGDLSILACTTAFGMGIDKPNVRDIAHLHVPESPESYVQEAGRAGRDGHTANAVLLLDAQARNQAADRIRHQWPSMDTVRGVLQGIANQVGLAVGTAMETPAEVNLAALTRAVQCRSAHVHTAVDLLSRAGVIELHHTSPSLKFSWLKAPKDIKPWANAVAHDQVWRQQLVLHNPPKRTETVSLNVHKWSKQSGGNATAGWDRLKQWEESGWIELLNADQQVSLSFPEARPSAANFTLPTGLLSDRIKESQERWQAMEQYLSTTTCRAVQLEAWFEDGTAEPCGICDICSPPAPPLEQEILEWIGPGISALDLKQRIPMVHHDVVRERLEDLRSQGKIEWRDAWIHPKR